MWKCLQHIQLAVSHSQHDEWHKILYSTCQVWQQQLGSTHIRPDLPPPEFGQWGTGWEGSHSSSQRKVLFARISSLQPALVVLAQLCPSWRNAVDSAGPLGRAHQSLSVWGCQAGMVKLVSFSSKLHFKTTFYIFVLVRRKGLRDYRIILKALCCLQALQFHSDVFALHSWRDTCNFYSFHSADSLGFAYQWPVFEHLVMPVFTCVSPNLLSMCLASDKKHLSIDYTFDGALENLTSQWRHVLEGNDRV